MPLKLNVGLSRKVGLPEFSSIGASCGVELELDAGLLQRDPEAFQAQVREAFAAVQQAVSEELVRCQAHHGPVVAAPANGHPSRNGALMRSNGHGAPPRAAPGRAHGDRGSSPKTATQSQVNAIYAIARAHDMDVAPLLAEQFGVEHVEQLSLAQASQLIDRLKGEGAG